MLLIGVLAVLANTSVELGKSPFPDALVGQWTTHAIHFHRDGTQLEEVGTIECEWILERTLVRCDRHHRGPSGAERRAMQLYSPQPNGMLDVLHFPAGKSHRVLQRSTAIDSVFVVLVGEVPVSGGRLLNIKARFSVLPENQLRYANEAEETPGKWRTDYVET